MRTTNRARALCAGLLGFALLTQPAYGQSPPESVCVLPDDQRPDQPVEPVELCAETTVTASTSRVLRVSLSEEVTISGSFGPEGNIDVEGEGPFVGFVLTEDLPERDGRLVLAGRLHSEPTPRDIFIPFGGPRHPEFAGTFPPGQYRLYILASGSSVTVTLRLSELDGHVEVEPSTPNRFDVRSLEPRIWEEAGRIIYSAGGDGELRTNGLLLQSGWFRTSNHVASYFGGCLYEGETPEPYAFLPGCPRGEGFGTIASDGPPPPPSRNFNHYVAFRGKPPGTYAQGAWYASASAMPSSAGSVVFWLDLE